MSNESKARELAAQLGEIQFCVDAMSGAMRRVRDYVDPQVFVSKIAKALAGEPEQPSACHVFGCENTPSGSCSVSFPDRSIGILEFCSQHLDSICMAVAEKARAASREPADYTRRDHELMGNAVRDEPEQTK